LASEAAQRVTIIAAQSNADAERFRSLGVLAHRLEVVGNLKFDMRVPDRVAEVAAEHRRHWGSDRPVWIAASTHEGEEWPVIEAHARVLRRFPDALLLVAPRHPERFKPMAQLCRGHGFATATRSEQALPGVGTQCFVVDTLGELLAFLACADVAFVGGSLDSIGGHNVLEPGALGVPVVVGPNTFNFAEVTDLMLERGAALRIDDSLALAQTVQLLFADAAQRQRMGESGRATVASARGAVQRTLAHIEALVGAD
jgi:3-deoxy-D-manno-octulosonic-acid transferase